MSGLLTTQQAGYRFLPVVYLMLMSDFSEAKLFQVPHFNNVNVTVDISSNEYDLIAMMLNHVTVRFSGGSKRYLYKDDLIAYAVAVNNKTSRSVEEC